MNNLLSYCGLVDASASEKDLPVNVPTTETPLVSRDIHVECWKSREDIFAVNNYSLNNYDEFLTCTRAYICR